MSGPDELQPNYDPETLREVFPDPVAVRARIEVLRQQVRSAPDDTAELLARGELVDLLRSAGDLDAALDEGRLAVERAEIAGTAAQQHMARLRLALVYQWRGEFAEANLTYTELVHAAPGFGPVVEAFTRQLAGTNAYEQGDYTGARDHFARALELREQFELPDEQITASRLALAAAQRRLEENA